MSIPVERRARLIIVPRPALIALASLRARLRASEFGMAALATGVGVLAGLCVAAMTKIVNVAHVAIFGIPFDVHLSAAQSVAPLAAFGAPMLGGLILGAIDAWLARKKAPPAVDPVEANALRGGRMSLSSEPAGGDPNRNLERLRRVGRARGRLCPDRGRGRLVSRESGRDCAGKTCVCWSAVAREARSRRRSARR